jgi:hypothetical protein
MTSLDPTYLFQLFRQKIDWGTLLTPVRKISDQLESFNTASKQVFLLDGLDLSGGNIPECKDVSGELFQNLTLDSNIKTIYGKLSDVCLLKEKDGTVSIGSNLNLFEFEKPLEELVSKTGLDKDIVKVLDQAKNTYKQFTKMNIGKIDLSDEKKDILGLFSAFILQEYDKSQTKDGPLKDKIVGEISILSSENKKYVEILDTTKMINNPKLCDISDNENTNLISVTTITKVREIDDKNYCIDFDTNRYYQQNRTLTIVTVPIDLKVKHIASTENEPSTETDQKNSVSELSSETKKSIVDSYVANYLNSFYNDPKKFNIEWMRLNDGVILLKVKQEGSKNIVFHKFDSNFAVLDKSECPEYKIDPEIKEYIRIEEFCQKKDTYKLKYVLIGSDHSTFTGFKVSKAQLQEVKTAEELEKFKNEFGMIDRVSTYRRTYRSYSGVCNSGNCGSSLYSYPYYYGNYWYGSYYVPPVVSTIVPTAPVINYTPYTYTYPPITTTYSLGTYYSPYSYYIPYSYNVPYTYVAPYTYSIPYTYYVKSVEGMDELYIGNRNKRIISEEIDEFDRYHIVQRNKDIKKYLF